MSGLASTVNCAAITSLAGAEASAFTRGEQQRHIEFEDAPRIAAVFAAAEPKAGDPGITDTTCERIC
jgi:hypothetical protein